eukprot:gene4053-20229_t
MPQSLANGVLWQKRMQFPMAGQRMSQHRSADVVYKGVIEPDSGCSWSLMCRLSWSILASVLLLPTRSGCDGCAPAEKRQHCKAAAQMTRQLFSEMHCLPQSGEGPRKGELKIARSYTPGWEATTACSPIPSAADKLILLGDFNARVEKEHEAWPQLLGKFEKGKMNSNCELLLTKCSEEDLAITNTFFNYPDKWYHSWKHPRSKHPSLLDYIITRRCDLKDFCSTRAMRGAECSTDDFMIRSKCHIKPKPLPMKKKGSKPPKKLNVKKLKEQSVNDQLVTAINENLQTLPTGTSNEQWRSLKNAVFSAASDVLGKPTRKHADWFEESNEEIMELVNEKNSLFHRTLDDRCTRGTRNERWREHFNLLLNPETNADDDATSSILQLPVRHHMDEPPTAEELDMAIKRTKCGKAAGADGIPPEVWTYGEPALRNQLLQLFCNIWSSTAEVPQDFKEATIVTIYKRKGDRAECGNHRGISLLSVAGKILAKILQFRLKTLAEDILPESRCRLRANYKKRVIVGYAEPSCVSEPVMLDTLTSNIRLYIRVKAFSNAKDMIEKARVLKSQTKAKALQKEIKRSTGPKDIAH